MSILVRGYYSQSLPVTLSGTSGSPNMASDVEAFPTDANSGWEFHTNGQAYRDEGLGPSIWQSGVEWYAGTPPITFYIRATLQSGSSPDNLYKTSSAVGSWLALTTQRNWYWAEHALGTTEGVLKIEIATDAAGADIVATGYYGGHSESN